MVAGISPTGPNISGLRLPPHWHFLPPGTCTTVGVAEGLGATPSPVGDPSLWSQPVAGDTWVEGDFPKPGVPKGRNGQGSSLWALTWPVLQGVNLAPVWGGGRGGLGTSSKRPGGWEQWGHCGRTGVRADCWHSQPAPRGGPSPSARCSALSPRYRQRPTHPPSPLTSPARPKPLAPAAPGGPSSSAHVDIQTAVTLQEAGACGPGRGGGGD